KSPTRYSSLMVAVAVLLASSQLYARPIGFSELSLMVRMHQSDADIRSDVAQRKILHPLTQPQENLLRQQGASDSLIKSLHDSNLVASNEEVAAVGAATVREHQIAAQQEGPQKCPVRC